MLTQAQRPDTQGESDRIAREIHGEYATSTVQFQSVRHFHDFSTFSKNLKKSDKSRKN